MKLEDQVCSLELSKRLKELGVKQESYFWWCEDLGEITLSANCRSYSKEKCGNHPSAFTVAELGEMLPEYCASRKVLHVRDEERWESEIDSEQLETEYGTTEANARAKMLIYLIENKLVTL